MITNGDNGQIMTVSFTEKELKTDWTFPDYIGKNLCVHVKLQT